MSHSSLFLDEMREIAAKLQPDTIEQLASELAALRERGGRLFLLGVGGSAGNCGHAVNDFRKLCGIEAYAPTDNVSELTARANDEGWHTIFSEWLKVSRANQKDALLILSVGGGNLEKNVSPNLVTAIQEAKNSQPQGVRHRRPRWWLHQEGGRRGRGDPHRRGVARDATLRSVPGRGLALSGVAPLAPASRHQVVSAIFLDRDGVINANILRDGRPVAPTTLEQFHLLPGVPEAVQMLKSAGFLVIVVTNQPDVRTGLTPLETVEAMHAEIRRQMPVDAIRACYHVDADRCNCRKPKPGLIVDAAREFGVDLASSYVVGDRWRDTAAGKAAGCLTVFVDYGYEQDGSNHPDIVVRSLPEAAARILDRKPVGVSPSGN